MWMVNGYKAKSWTDFDVGYYAIKC